MFVNGWGRVVPQPNFLIFFNREKDAEFSKTEKYVICCKNTFIVHGNLPCGLISTSSFIKIYVNCKLKSSTEENTYLGIVGIIFLVFSCTFLRFRLFFWYAYRKSITLFFPVSAKNPLHGGEAESCGHDCNKKKKITEPLTRLQSPPHNYNYNSLFQLQKLVFNYFDGLPL